MHAVIDYCNTLRFYREAYIQRKFFQLGLLAHKILLELECIPCCRNGSFVNLHMVDHEVTCNLYLVECTHTKVLEQKTRNSKNYSSFIIYLRKTGRLVLLDGRLLAGY